MSPPYGVQLGVHNRGYGAAWMSHRSVKTAIQDYLSLLGNKLLNGKFGLKLNFDML